jgi:hypothetical protein
VTLVAAGERFPVGWSSGRPALVLEAIADSGVRMDGGDIAPGFDRSRPGQFPSLRVSEYDLNLMRLVVGSALGSHAEVANQYVSAVWVAACQ